jgi:hypothetical protein
MAEGLVNSLIDRKAIAEEVESVQKMLTGLFGEIAKSVKELEDQNRQLRVVVL